MRMNHEEMVAANSATTLEIGDMVVINLEDSPGWWANGLPGIVSATNIQHSMDGNRSVTLVIVDERKPGVKENVTRGVKLYNHQVKVVYKSPLSATGKKHARAS